MDNTINEKGEKIVARLWDRLLKDYLAGMHKGKEGAPETAENIVDDVFGDNRLYGKQDLDNIIFMSSFRRLQGKAQVFPLENNDYTRTRLTHSLEVMSISEALGEKLVSEIKHKNDCENKELLNNIPYVLRAASLAHDLGNPPFGHLGENLIAEWFKEKGDDIRISSGIGVNRTQTIATILGDSKKDFSDFDGNAQTLRILLNLQDVYYDNLNDSLTSSIDWSHQLLATLIKYPYDSRGVVYGGKNKRCVFKFEKKIYDTLQKEFNLDGKRYPLTYLLEAADDIAYLTSDLEDGIKKGHISYEEFIKRIREQYKTSKCEGTEDSIANRILSLYNRKVMAENRNDIIKKLVKFVKGQFIRAVCEVIQEKYQDISTGNINNTLIQLSRMKSVEDIIRDLLYNNVYYCDEIVRKKIQGRKVIYLLLDRFVPAVINGFGKENADTSSCLYSLMMSTNYSRICKYNVDKAKDDREKLYAKLCLVIDMISSMTDKYAFDMYTLLM